MNLKRGDLVTRKSYNHDTIFKITNIKNDIYYLKGVEVRLYADSDLKDLVKYIDKVEESDDTEEILLDRNEYFYLPGKVLHIDGDKEYLEKCLKYYKKNGILAIGKKISEDHIYETILPLLNEYKPDIIIITGHDAYYSKKGDINNLKNYRKKLYLTELGRRTGDIIAEKVENMLNIGSQGLSEKDVENLYSSLTKISENLTYASKNYNKK